jgi:hypothetical protein
MSHISCICRCCRTCAIEDVRHIGYFRSVLRFAADARSQMCGTSAGSVLLCDLPHMLDHKYVAYQLDCLSCRTCAIEDVWHIGQIMSIAQFATHFRSQMCGTLVCSRICRRCSIADVRRISWICPGVYRTCWLWHISQIASAAAYVRSKICGLFARLGLLHDLLHIFD